MNDDKNESESKVKIDVNKVSLSRGAFLSLAKSKLLHVEIKYK